MNFVFFVIFSLAVFLASLICYKKYRSTTLYALAIGGVVNANFFHAGNYPINCFNLPFGIDSIIYTLFVFCVVVMFIKDGKKQAYLLAFSSIIAIMFSATMQLISDLLSFGSSADVWTTFLTFCISSIASVISIVVMIEILNKLKPKTNSYVLLIVGIAVVAILDTIIYYPLATLINGVPENIFILLLTSILGKLIALGCGMLSLFFMNIIEKKHNSKQ